MKVPDGWGSIYCQTWFGDYRNVRNLPYQPDCILPSVVTDYFARVTTDSGITEAGSCVANLLIDLGWYEWNTYTKDFIIRVEADSGILEAIECLDNRINELNL